MSWWPWKSQNNQPAPGAPLPPLGPPGSWLARPHDTVSLTLTAGQTTTTTVHIGNPAELGLQVPSFNAAATVEVKVGALADGTDAVKIVDQGGTQKLLAASSTGSFAFSSNEMGACLGYAYMTIVISAAQAADKTFILHRKSVAGQRIS